MFFQKDLKRSEHCIYVGIKRFLCDLNVSVNNKKCMKKVGCYDKLHEVYEDLGMKLVYLNICEIIMNKKDNFNLKLK